MKSTLEFEDIIYNRLKASSLASAITGSLRKHERPINSTKEDVVINSLPVNNFQLQTGLLNVNIHVPNLSVFENGVSYKVANTVRLQQLFDLAKAVLVDYMVGDTYFDIQQELLFVEEDSSYINIRLDFFSINILN